MDDSCTRCRFGRINQTTACFVGKWRSQPLVASSILAYSCDLCGWIEYDADSLQMLDTLLQQPSKPPAQAYSPHKSRERLPTIVSVE